MFQSRPLYENVEDENQIAITSLADDVLFIILSLIPIKQLLGFRVSYCFYQLALENICQRVKVKDFDKFNEKLRLLGDSKIQLFVLEGYYTIEMAEKVKAILALPNDQRLRVIYSQAKTDVVEIDAKKKNILSSRSNNAIMLWHAKLVTLDMITTMSPKRLKFLLNSMSLVRPRIITPEQVATIVNTSFIKLLITYQDTIYQYVVQSQKNKIKTPDRFEQIEINRAFKALMKKYVEIALAIACEEEDDIFYEGFFLYVLLAYGVRSKFESLLKNPVILDKNIISIDHAKAMQPDRLVGLVNFYLQDVKNPTLISPVQAFNLPSDDHLTHLLGKIEDMDGEYLVSRIAADEACYLTADQLKFLLVSSVFHESRTENPGMRYWDSLSENVKKLYLIDPFHIKYSTRREKISASQIRNMLTNEGMKEQQEEFLKGIYGMNGRFDNLTENAVSKLEVLFPDMNQIKSNLCRVGSFKDIDSFKHFFLQPDLSASVTNISSDNPVPYDNYGDAKNVFKKHGKFLHFTVLDLVSRNIFKFSEIKNICGDDYYRGRFLYLIAVAIYGQFATAQEILSMDQPRKLFETLRKRMGKTFNLYLDLYYRFLAYSGKDDDAFMNLILNVNSGHVPNILINDSFPSLILNIFRINSNVGVKLSLLATEYGIDFFAIAKKYKTLNSQRSLEMATEYSEYENDIVMFIKDHLDSYCDPAKFLTSYSNVGLFGSQSKHHILAVSKLLTSEKYRELNRDKLIEFFNELLQINGLNEINQKGSLYAIVTIASFLLRVDLFAPQLECGLVGGVKTLVNAF